MKIDNSLDAAVADSERDILDRKRLALQLYAACIATPKNFSTRIGVLGAWGTGKTSVVKMVEFLARKESHLTVYVEAWAATSSSILVDKIIGAVIDEAKAQVVPLSLKNRAKRFVSKHSEKFNGFGNSAAQLSELAHPIAGAVVGVLSSLPGKSLEQLSKFKGQHSQELVQALGEKKVIVVIDDLDRIDPKILPHVLLTLRDSLDLPGFVFLLPFDDKNITTSIRSYHEAWQDAYSFLDKIVDYSVVLPDLSPKQAWDLFESEVVRSQICKKLAKIKVGEFLPLNPRKIKQIARRFDVLENSRARFAEDEYDDELLFYFECLRAFSPELVRRVLNHFHELPTMLTHRLTTSEST